MISKNKFIIGAVLLGLITGIAASSFYPKDTETKCEKAENAIRNQANVSGAIACFEQGEITVNMSEEVEQGSELECVCRRSYQGNVQLWTINRAD